MRRSAAEIAAVYDGPGGKANLRDSMTYRRAADAASAVKQEVRIGRDRGGVHTVYASPVGWRVRGDAHCLPAGCLVLASCCVWARAYGLLRANVIHRPRSQAVEIAKADFPKTVAALETISPRSGGAAAPVADDDSDDGL